MDFSAVDAFWHVADVLASDKDPASAEWDRLVRTPGYRLALRYAPDLRHDMEVALRPSNRRVRDSLAAASHSVLPSRVEYLAAAYADRRALAAYRDSISKAAPVEQATAIAQRFLPPHATDGRPAPAVVFALFTDDAYPVGADTILVDLEHVKSSADLTLLLAHEFHHSYLLDVNALTFPPGDDPSLPLVRALSAARNEGIADLIDKPFPLHRPGKAGELYSAMYNEAYVRTPSVIRSIDSALATAAADSTKLEAVGRRVAQLLPSGGHFNGSYMAREIYDTFGVDSLFPGVRNTFAFWRTYAEAELRRGHPAPFSPTAVALLDALESRYVLHR